MAVCIYFETVVKVEAGKSESRKVGKVRKNQCLFLGISRVKENFFYS
jgi:hypothetical protein